MAKDSSTSNSDRRWPWAAVIATLVILAGEAAFWLRVDPLNGSPLFIPKVDDAALMVKRELIAEAGGRIVLTGDSSCMMGLKPDLITDSLGQPSVNLGTLSSHTTHGFADMIRRACERDVRPTRIVLALLPQSLEVSEAKAREMGLFARYCLADGRTSSSYSITASERLQWFGHKHQFNIFPPEFGGSLRQYRADLLAHRGWYPEKKTYAKADVVRGVFEPTPFSEAGIESAIATAKEYAIPLTLWWSPYPQDAQLDEHQSTVAAWTTRLQARHPHVSIPRKTVPAWAPGRFGTVTHVNPAAAEINSRELAAALQP